MGKWAFDKRPPPEIEYLFNKDLCRQLYISCMKLVMIGYEEYLVWKRRK